MFRSDALHQKKMDPRRFLPVLRDAEALAIDAGKPILIYYSNQSAGRLLPKGPKFRDIMREALCVSIYSMDTVMSPDECSFILMTPKGGLFIDMVQCEVESDGDKYWCSGSVSIAETYDRYRNLEEQFRKLDEAESERLHECYIKMPPANPDAQLFDEFQRKWNEYGN